MSHDRRLCQYYTDILRLVWLVSEAIKRNRFGIGKQADRRKQGGMHYKEGSKLMGSYSSDVHIYGVWRVLCMSNIDKTLVNFLFQVNSKTAFQVNFWLMGLYLPARLQTSLDLREPACRFTANKVFSLQHRETLNFPPSIDVKKR